MLINRKFNTKIIQSQPVGDEISALNHTNLINISLDKIMDSLQIELLAPSSKTKCAVS